jgi:hypothetical protein
MVSYSASLEIPHFYGRRMCVIVLDCFQSHLNPFHTFTPFFSNIRNNAVLQSTVRYIRWPYSLLGCYATPSGRSLTSLLISSLALRTWGRRHLIYPKNQWTATDYAVLHPRRRNSLWSLLWEPQIQHFLQVQTRLISSVCVHHVQNPSCLVKST